MRARAYQTHHAKGHVVARNGSRVDSWMGVRSGFLKVSLVSNRGKSLMLTGVPERSWIGEGSVMKGEPRRYDVLAMRETTVVHIPSDLFLELLDAEPGFGKFIVELMNERVSQYFGRLEADRFGPPVARLARAILTEMSPVLRPGAGPSLPISQKEFGELTGLSRQTTNSALKILERAGGVRVRYGGIDGVNNDVLKALSSGGRAITG